VAASDSVDVSGWLDEHLAAASPDLLRVMIKQFAQALMNAEVDAVCGAGYRERSDDRVNSRNGYRLRDWDTRAGSIELAIPKLRSGSYFPEWLLERRRRAEQALISVIATSYLLGVSTRRVEKLVGPLGIAQLSKSQVSEMAKSLDAQVEAFRSRPLDSSPYTFLWLDALTQKVREGGRTVIVHALVRSGSPPMDSARSSAWTSSRARTERLVGLSALAGRARALRGCAGHFRRSCRVGRGHRRHSRRRQLATIIRQHQPWREVPAGPPPPPGEDLGSVTFEVQRQTRPSRRWSSSIGQWESCLEHLDERPEGPARRGPDHGGPPWQKRRCNHTSGRRSPASIGAAAITSCAFWTPPASD
jgi:hypothetical protein